MEYTIHSRRLKRDVTFSRPGKYYLYVDLGGHPGTLGQQMCEYGKLRGNTLYYEHDNIQAFTNICRRWWNAYLRRTASDD